MRTIADWRLLGLSGVVLLIAGLLAIVYPGKTLLALGIIAGVSLLVSGAGEFADSLTGTPDSRALSAIVGVLAMLAGIVCLRRPGESLLVLVIALGIFLVVSGLVHFLRAFSDLDDRALNLGLALLDVVLGVLVLALPGLSLATLAILFGASLVAHGVAAVVFAVMRRRRPPPRDPGATPARALGAA